MTNVMLLGRGWKMAEKDGREIHCRAHVEREMTHHECDWLDNTDDSQLQSHNQKLLPISNSTIWQSSRGNTHGFAWWSCPHSHPSTWSNIKYKRTRKSFVSYSLLPDAISLSGDFLVVSLLPDAEVLLSWAYHIEVKDFAGTASQSSLISPDLRGARFRPLQVEHSNYCWTSCHIWQRLRLIGNAVSGMDRAACMLDAC